jgi:hypothetical protein
MGYASFFFFWAVSLTPHDGFARRWSKNGELSPPLSGPRPHSPLNAPRQKPFFLNLERQKAYSASLGFLILKITAEKITFTRSLSAQKDAAHHRTRL